MKKTLHGWNGLQDHFGLILNEPAGKIAQVVVENSVNLIVKAWSNNDDPDQVITQVGDISPQLFLFV